MQTRANDRLPLSRRVVLNQRNSNDIQKLSTFPRFNEFQRPHDSRESDFLDENRQFSTRNSFIDESGIRVGIVTQKDRLVGDVRTLHRPRTQIIFNPWNMAPRYPSRQSFSMNLLEGKYFPLSVVTPGFELQFVSFQEVFAKAVDSEMKVKDWDSLIVDPENSNTFDWENENELGAGHVISVKSFMKTLSSDEGSLPQRNIFPHETCRPLTFSQLMTLERNILLADYEIDSVRFPPIRVAPVDIISRLKRKISTLVEGARVESIRIMGGVASHIISSSFPFNDLDILFNLTFDFEERHRIFKQIRNQVCLVLLDILVQECPKELEKVLRRDNLSHEHASTHFPTAYFQKYIVVPPAHDKTATEDDDCWSLICLRNLLGQNLEFKFVRCCEGGMSLKRHFEFSSDSFQIVIDDAYLNHMETIVKRSKRLFSAKTAGESTDLGTKDNTSDEIEEEFRVDAQLSYKWLPHNKDILFPHVYVVCMYPNFDEALSHLQKRHVKIYRPEELRGGGLLKYAYLRQNDFRDDPNETSESLRLAINAMVCRFLITLPDSQAQWHTIFKYLETHYPRQYPRNLDKRVNYLMILLNILAQSNAYAIEQAKSLYGVIKAMIDWIRNEMKELENQQKGEPSDFRGWNRKYTPTATPVSAQALPPQKLNQHMMPTNPVFAYRPMAYLGTTMQNRPAHVFNQPTRQVKKQPHPVEYRPYANKGFMEPVRVYSEEQVIADRYSYSHAETRMPPLSSNQSFNESLRTHPQQNGVLLTHQPLNNHTKQNFRSASAGASNSTATSLQWDAWCNT